jgi:hypothetical protein
MKVAVKTVQSVSKTMLRKQLINTMQIFHNDLYDSNDVIHSSVTVCGHTYKGD